VAFDVYDYRTDIRNIIITPEIRSRFMRLEPGQVSPFHSHDLGHEIFLILDGQCEFEMDGERKVLGPGQMCYARTDQLHQVRTIGDKPMIMYLSVTPHIEPTHTWWDENGEKLPPRYGTSTKLEREARTEPPEPLKELIARHLDAAQAIADAAAENTAAQKSEAAALQRAMDAGDREAAKAALDAMWAQLFRVFHGARELAVEWNELAARCGAES
jgi:quercetin dioxygenase-like cupin family protein